VIGLYGVYGQSLSRERDRGTCTCYRPDRRATLLKELTRTAGAASVVRLQEVMSPALGRQAVRWQTRRGWKFTRKSALRTWHAHLHYQTHGNVLPLRKVRMQSVDLHYQTRGNVLPSRKLHRAEGETALPNARERVAFAQVALRRV